MFIRKNIKIDKNTKKKYFTYHLVESVRTEKGPRQRMLLNIGSTLDLNEKEKRIVIKRIDEILSGIKRLFPYEDYIEDLSNRFAKELLKKKAEVFQPKESEYCEVDLHSIENENPKTVGIEIISYNAIKELGLDEKLKELGLSKRQIEVAIGAIIGKLAVAKSELGMYEWLKNESALDEIIKTDFSKLALRKVYEITDVLLSKKNAIEKYLERKEKTLFDLEDKIVLYDLTNTYFEGRPNNKKAKRGKSKENRTDAPLITLGLVLNKEGFVKKSRIYEGNVSEPKTLNQVIEDIKILDKKPILIMDKGIATKDNLKWLRENRYPYIVASRKKDECIGDYEVIKKDKNNTVSGYIVENLETNEIELHCHSTSREKKEEAIKTTFQKRFEESLKKLVPAKKRKMYKKAIEQLGRIKQKYSRIGSLYEVTLIPDETKKYLKEVKWEFKEKKATEKFQGKYILRANLVDFSAKELWETYTMLTGVEESFRSLKSELGLRPIYHQKELRIDAHLFLTVLAYHVLHSIRYRLKNNGINYSWETIRKNMRTQIRVTTLMKTRTNKTIRIRKTTNPEPFHKMIYHSLNLSASSIEATESHM